MEKIKKRKQRRLCIECRRRLTVYSPLPRSEKWTCPVCRTKIAERREKEEAIRNYEARRRMMTNIWWAD